MKTSLWLVPISLLLVATPRVGGSKCSPEELAQFSQEYEQCHGRALQKLKTDTAMLGNKHNNIDNQRSETQKMVCSALQSLIEDCTVILGWCYTSSEVDTTKQKQKILLEQALHKMFPDFDIQQCLVSSDNVHPDRMALPRQEKKASVEPSSSSSSHFLPLVSLIVIMSLVHGCLH